jgi:hypothetical protein
MPHEPMIFLHLKLVAKISLAVGALAALALLTVLTLITGDSGEFYGDIIRSHSLTRQHLGAAMLVAGLVLVAITGFITWLIVWYSTFRVAGPLYRFSQNLKLASVSDSVELIDLRKGDALAPQAEGIKQAVTTLRAHYAEVKIASGQAAAALAAGDAAHYAEAIARLKGLDEKIRV